MSEHLIVLSKAYRCPHCRKLYEMEHYAKLHLTHCWWNPNRQPKIGELTFESDKYAGVWESSWHPGRAGMMFTEGGWVEVPGYKRGRGMFEDEQWPHIELPGTGERATYDYPGSPNAEVRFDQLTRLERVYYWADLIEQWGDAIDGEAGA